MEKGSYRGCRVDIGRYAVTRFTPHLFSVGPGFGCGPSTLALLTGVAPHEILRQHSQRHYSDRFMIGFLRRHGFETLKLTQCLVSMSDTLIGRNYIVLLSQLFTRNEGTWGVVFDRIYLHNFKVYQLDELSLLNKPVLSAYLVCDPRFSHFNDTGKRPPARKRQKM